MTISTTTTIARTGPEFLVNSHTAGAQSAPQITGLANGGFVVTWYDDSAALGDASGYSVKAQIHDASGARIGSEFLVNTSISGNQIRSAVASLADGRFVVTWEDNSGTLGDASISVKAQIFTAEGQKSGGEFLVNSSVAGAQGTPTITGLADGGFAVSWEDASGTLGDTSGTGIKVQIFDNGGAKVGSEMRVNTNTALNQLSPAIAKLSGGGFVIAWEDNSRTLGDADGTSVKAQLLGANGEKLGGEFRVNTNTSGAQGNPSITGLANGGFVATWQDGGGTLGDASSFAVKAQVFDAGGEKIGGEFLVNTGKANAQLNSSITALADGGFVIVWEDLSLTLGDASGSSIKAQVFDASGHKVGGEFLVNTYTEYGQQVPTITALADGGFVVSWQDQSGTLGDSSGTAIKAQVYSLTTTHTGTAESDVMVGSGGTDTFLGGAGADIMTGGLGNDTYHVDDFDDQVIEAAGEGVDTVMTALNNYTLADDVENLIIDGTTPVNVFGNTLANVITGNDGRNVIHGGDGNDVIYSNGGDDYLDGDAGADTYYGGSGNASYVFDDAGDVVRNEVAAGGTDTIWSSISVRLAEQGQVENLRLAGDAAINGTGNALANVITGNGMANLIAGGAGNDTLWGKGGDDTFHFREYRSINKDAIWDFDADDKISLDASVFTGLGTEDGHLASSSFVNGAAATVAGQATIIYTAWTGTLSYDADGKGGHAAQEIAFIGKNLGFFDNADILTA